MMSYVSGGDIAQWKSREITGCSLEIRKSGEFTGPLKSIMLNTACGRPFIREGNGSA